MQMTMTTESQAAASCWPSCRSTAAGSVALAGTWRPLVLQSTRLAGGWTYLCLLQRASTRERRGASWGHERLTAEAVVPGGAPELAAEPCCCREGKGVLWPQERKVLGNEGG